MSEQKDGGPAFPTVARDDNWQPSCDGMSLRDYFAAKALVGYIANSEESGSEPTLVWLAGEAHDPIAIAHVCYRMADAMLRAREAQ